jgi:hypothetical protein
MGGNILPLPMQPLSIQSRKSGKATGSAMPHSPLMYGLIKLHSRLEGELRRNRKNLAHVRAVIEIISPDFDIASIRPKRQHTRNDWFKRGTGFLVALEVLREAKEPLSMWEICRRMLAKRGVTNPKERDLRVVANLIKNTLDRYNGKAVQSHGVKRFRRWSVTSTMMT